MARLYWDRCPRWYAEQPTGATLVRWARRWQPGVSALTPAGDDLLTLVRHVDRLVAEAARSE